jgi:hypothetical protein
MRTATDILFGYCPYHPTLSDIPDIQHRSITSIPSFAADLFFASLFARLVRVRRDRSTGSKQTLNGLFICTLTVLQLLKCLLSLMINPGMNKMSIGSGPGEIKNPALLYPVIRGSLQMDILKSLKFCFQFARPSKETGSRDGRTNFVKP